MGAGTPVSWSFMDAIAQNYVDSTGGMPHGVLPGNFRYSDPRRGSERYIWSNPPGKRRMFFSKSLGIPGGEYNVPGVVYEATDCTLSIYAYKGEKLKPDSALYWGPFFNTTQGSVCLGTSSLKKPLNPTYAELAEYWEKRFWLTEFTHLGGGGNPTKGNLVVVTKDSAGNPFDEKELLSAGKKLKDLF
jgi:PRTRC genetic system protein B